MNLSIDCRYIRERPSGIGTYTQALIDRIPALDPSSRFALWVDPRAARPLTAHPNVYEQPVAAPANGLRTLLIPSKLADLQGTDVFHAPFNILGAQIPCATVVTLHDLMWLEAPWLCEANGPATPFFYAFYRNGIRRALRRAQRIVAISEATAHTIARMVPAARSKVRVVYHGISNQFCPANDRQEASAAAGKVLGSEGPYFLVVGQNSPSKNHAAILSAFAAARLDPSYRLVLVQRLYQRGRWGLSRKPQLLDLAQKLGIAQQVLWMPYLDEAQLLSLLQGAAALIQFSRYEGFGLPVLEAMACGTPIVASNIPVLVEVVGGAGLHAELSVEALAKQLKRVATEPSLLAELAAKSVARSRTFSWDKCAREHLAVYREAAAA